tara:strand:- start:69 stop:1295 length:1227 start_codon:yes stop_codon:yes gene_type:complete
MSKALQEFLKFVTNLLRKTVTSSDKKIPPATKAEITQALQDASQVVQRDIDRIDEQLEVLKRIERQLTDVGEPRRGAQVLEITKDSSVDDILQDLANKAGTSPEAARQSIINRANEAYLPNDPKRMRMDDDVTLQAYLQSKIQMGASDELLEDVIEGGGAAMTRPRSIYDEMAEDEMLPFGRSGESGLDAIRKGIDQGQIKTPDDDLMSGIARAEKALKQKDVDLEKVEQLMMDPENFGKSIDELMQMVQDDKVIPLIKYMPNPKPTKKAEGGRIHAMAGLFTGLGKFFKKMGMKAPDKIADVKQMQNVIRDEGTDLTRRIETPKDKRTIDEIEQMFMDDPRYKGRTQAEMMKEIDKEKIRVDFAYNMGMEPEDIPNDVIEALYKEGYHLKFANGGAVGVGSLFKRRK